MDKPASPRFRVDDFHRDISSNLRLGCPIDRAERALPDHVAEDVSTQCLVRSVRRFLVPSALGNQPIEGDELW